MQNIKGQTFKDLQKFPDMFTFKAVGENSNKFSADIRKVFDGRDDVIFSENMSKTGKYISISITTEVWTFEELESLYKGINQVEGLRFHI